MYATPRASGQSGLGGPDVATSGGSRGDSDNAVRFTLLGPLEIRKGGADYAPTAPKVLQLLAMLVSSPGQVVHIDSIIRELWANDPPRTVRKTMHIYVHHLRRCLDQLDLTPDTESALITKAPGYLLRIDPEQVDIAAFRSLREQGSTQLHQQHYDAAAHSLRAALAVWSGPPLANVRCGPVLSAYVVELLEQRRSTRQQRIEAEINAGMDAELVGELRALVAANPLDEVLTGQLIRVLSRNGRRSDAMASYRQLRARLNDELGVEPCVELQQLHLELLCSGDQGG